MLRTYIQEISGAELELVDEGSQNDSKKKIYIGNIQDEVLEPGEIIITTEKKNLFISGGSDMAVKYAVFEFLEKFFGLQVVCPGVKKFPRQRT